MQNIYVLTKKNLTIIKLILNFLNYIILKNNLNKYFK